MKKKFIAEFPTTTAIAANAGVVTGKLQQMASGFVYTDAGAVFFDDAKFALLDDLLDREPARQHDHRLPVQGRAGRVAAPLPTGVHLGRAGGHRPLERGPH
jgi:hypothetical protein